MNVGISGVRAGQEGTLNRSYLKTRFRSMKIEYGIAAK